MFHRRSGSAGRHLRWRVILLGIGAVLALAGIGLERDWLLNVALGVLVLGFGLRFVPGGDEAEE
jgi:hypothetical protein